MTDLLLTRSVAQQLLLDELSRRILAELCRHPEGRFLYELTNSCWEERFAPETGGYIIAIGELLKELIAAGRVTRRADERYALAAGCARLDRLVNGAWHPVYLGPNEKAEARLEHLRGSTDTRPLRIVVVKGGAP